MNAVTLYWLTRLDAIKGSLPWLFVIPLVAAIMYTTYLAIVAMDYNGRVVDAIETYQVHRMYKLWLITLISLVVVTIAEVLIPSTKDALIIQGIDKLTNSPEIQNLVGLIYEKLQSLLAAK